MEEKIINEEFEVRDLREKDQFKIDDKFLNGYAKYVEIYAVGVYNSLCRHAQFKSQRAFPSAEKIAEELNISKPKVFYSIWVLEIFNIIKRHRIGKKCNNRYDLLHKKHWKSVAVIKEKIKSDVNHINISDVNHVNIPYKRHLHHVLTTLTSIVRITNSKENKSDVLSATADEIYDSMNSSSGQKDKSVDIFSSKGIIEEMINDQQKHIQVVGIYWKWLGWSFENKVQYQSALKRDLRAASALKGYSLARIKRTFKKLDGDSANGEKFAWNLNTVHKTIDNVK